MLPQQNQPSSLPPEEATQAALPEPQRPLPPSTENAGAPPSLRLSTPTDAAYEYLHHVIIGSPKGVNDAVERLHLLHYVEHRLWTPQIAVGEQGLTITQAEGQVLRYLVRSRPRASA